MSNDSNFTGYDADFTYPIACLRSSADSTDRWWVLCDQALFKSSGPSSVVMVQDALSNSPTTIMNHLYSDMEDFNDSLLVTTSTDIARLNAGAWDVPSSGKRWWRNTLAQPALTSAPHPIKRIFNNLVAIGDGQYIHTIDINSNVYYQRLNFGSQYETTWIRSSETMVWFGARHKYSGVAKVFGWDGKSENFTVDYEVGGEYCFSGIIKDGIPWIINGLGQLKRYNGAGFTEVAHFPVFVTEKLLDDNFTVSVNVTRNGMEIVDDKIHILLNGCYNGSDVALLENQLSGIWCYDSQIGLYHRFSITKDTGSGVEDNGSPAIFKGGFLKNTQDKNMLMGVTLDKAHGGGQALIHVMCNLEVDTNTTIRRGYIITPKLTSSNIEETFDEIFTKFRSNKQNANDALIINYRKYKKLYITDTFETIRVYTWVDSTHCTINNEYFNEIQVGEEIEILSGEGSGRSVKITAIGTPTGNVYPITIDQAITGASGTFAGRISNWTKVSEVSCNGIDFDNDSSIGENSPEVQLKIELISYGDSLELQEVVVSSESNTPIE
jgi:hypothetical protein